VTLPNLRGLFESDKIIRPRRVLIVSFYLTVASFNGAVKSGASIAAFGKYWIAHRRISPAIPMSADSASIGRREHGRIAGGRRRDLPSKLVSPSVSQIAASSPPSLTRLFGLKNQSGLMLAFALFS
jgi:hypothetical protein